MDSGAQPSRVQEGDFSLKELVKITGNFSEVIGSGGFGTVYKGQLGNGQAVAVKRISNDISKLNNTVQKFKDEVNILKGIEHRNIVRLIGYCYEVNHKATRMEDGTPVWAEMHERLICLEYMRNGSLHEMLGKSHELEWGMHFNIIKGISAGLSYLHRPRQQGPIIHLDLKPANILLDDDMEPKITDFGLSWLFGEDQTRTITKNVVATKGYIAPEYVTAGVISVKSDIFSLGIIILELVTGLEVPRVHLDVPNVVRNYIADVRSEMSKIKLRYPSLDSKIEVKRCIEVGIRCLEMEPSKRPTAEDIYRMLTGELPLRDTMGHVLQARELRLLHSEKCWTWSYEAGSRFQEYIILNEVWFFHMEGVINTKDLINDATYEVYLVYKLGPEASGFEGPQSSEIKISNGGQVLTSNTVCLDSGDGNGESCDGWKELKLGEFKNSIQCRRHGVTVELSEKTDTFPKKGLHVGAMEVRPYYA